MSIDTIFGELAAHMVEGMMFHDELAQYYDFLNLGGYKRCHEYHFFEETIGYRKLCRYYENHYNKLVDSRRVQEQEGVIPDNWYGVRRQEVDAATKRTAVRDAVGRWVSWETGTKKLYEQKYVELISLGEVAAAEFVKDYINDVSDELKYAERKQLALSAMGYDMIMIVSEQPEIHDHYKIKTKGMEIRL